MNFFNNNPYGGPVGYGTVQQPIVMPKRSNILNAEQINQLRAKEPDFNLAITKEELLKGLCTHIDQNGNPSLIEAPEPGYYQCTICGSKFAPVEGVTREQLEEDIRNVINELQTIKLLFVDMPAQAAAEYFQIIPMLEKMPKLYQVASENNNKYETNNYTNGFNSANPFLLLQSMMGGQPMMNQPMYGQPMMNQPYGQPMMNQPVYGQPMGPTPQQAAMVGANQFAQTGAPVQTGYAPSTAGYAYTPGQPPTATTSPTTVPTTVPTTQDSSVTVTAQMQA